MTAPLEFQGTQLWKGMLTRAEQEAMVHALRKVGAAAPFRQYLTPGGKAMSVRMSGAGPLAWMSDRSGYAYRDRQPDGQAWPDIPTCVLNVWERVVDANIRPDSCLINYYGEGAKMGLHQDRDEQDTQWPVVSVSLGDDAQFRVGGLTRSAPTRSVWLSSGDVVVLCGAARLAFHGVDRIKFGSSALLDRGGRINVTLRVAGRPD